MTIAAIRTALTSTYTVADFSSYYISRNGSIITTASGAAITNAAAQSSTAVSITVAGEIAGWNGDGISLNANASGGTFNRVTVEKTGSVSSPISAVSFQGYGNYVFNAGTITGAGGFNVFGEGVSAFGSGLTVENTGFIGGNKGITISFPVYGSDDIDRGNTINNSGMISGGIQVAAQSLDLVNTGDIVSTTNGVIVDGSATGVVNIVNSGTISGAANVAKGSSVRTGDGTDRFVNHGEINGAVDMGLGNDTLKNSGSIQGSVTMGAGNDTYKGQQNGSVSGTIDGGAGDDVLKGSEVADELLGGAGNDVLKGRGGNDILTDTSGSDDFWGGDGDDTITAGAGLNTIYGGKGDDDIDGGGGIDHIEGGKGDDTLRGGKGRDTIDGGLGDDIIDGGSKNDIITGGRGNDIMLGGSGSDIFVFSRDAGNDIINDFANGFDKLDFSKLGLDFGTVIGSSLDVTGGVLINLGPVGGGNMALFLQGMTVADLDVSDFIF